MNGSSVWPGGPSPVAVPECVDTFILEDSMVAFREGRKGARVVVMNCGSTRQLADNVIGCAGPLLRDGEWALGSLGMDPGRVCVVLRSSLAYNGEWPAGWVLFRGKPGVARQWLSQWRLPPAVGRVCVGGSMTALVRLP